MSDGLSDGMSDTQAKRDTRQGLGQLLLKSMRFRDLSDAEANVRSAYLEDLRSNNNRYNSVTSTGTEGDDASKTYTDTETDRYPDSETDRYTNPETYRYTADSDKQLYRDTDTGSDRYTTFYRATRGARAQYTDREPW